ncbi:MAG: putative rane protein [Chloroflexi bacterium]|nr:putative rane protein [Chloroflexota bacterium]
MPLGWEARSVQICRRSWPLWNSGQHLRRIELKGSNMVHSSVSAGRTARSASQAARGPGSEILARLGYVAKGLVYVIIGVLAARVAVGDGGKTTDTKGALTAIYQQPFGKVLLAAVIVGLIGYALWCFLRAFLDADGRGADAKGIIARIAYGIVGVLYVSLAYAALRLITGSGSAGKSTDASTQDWTAKLLQQSYGKPLVIIAGIVVIGVAAYLAYYAYTGEFLKQFSSMSNTERNWVRRFGTIGYLAQAVVFAEIGIFLIVAAQQGNAHAAKGIGGSLKQLANEPYGHLLLALVAIGFVIYGIYSFAQARFRRIATV